MRSWWSLLLLLWLGVLGCRTLPPAPPSPEVAVDRILARLKEGQGKFSAFTARGRLTLISPQQNATGTALVAGKLPETLRVELKDPLGRSQLIFFSDGQRVEILFPQEGKLFQGPATPATLAAFVPPVMTLSQAVRLLGGEVPFSEGPPTRWRFEAGGNFYVLEWLKEEGRLQERLWVAAEDLTPRKVEWFGSDGQAAFTAEMAGSLEGAKGRPQKLRLTTTSPPLELHLAYREFTLNPALGLTDLRIPKPPGVKVFPLKP